MPLCQPVILLKQSQRCATWDGKNYSSSPKDALPRLFSWDAQAMMQSDASCSFTISCRDSKRSVQKVSKSPGLKSQKIWWQDFHPFQQSQDISPENPCWLCWAVCPSPTFSLLLPIQRTQEPILLMGLLGNLTHPVLHGEWELHFRRVKMTSLLSLLPEFLPVLKGRSRFTLTVCAVPSDVKFVDGVLIPLPIFLFDLSLQALSCSQLISIMGSKVCFPGVSSFLPGAQVKSSPVGCPGWKLDQHYAIVT